MYSTVFAQYHIRRTNECKNSDRLVTDGRFYRVLIILHYGYIFHQQFFGAAVSACDSRVF